MKQYCGHILLTCMQVKWMGCDDMGWTQDDLEQAEYIREWSERKERKIRTRKHCIAMIKVHLKMTFKYFVMIFKNGGESL